MLGLRKREIVNLETAGESEGDEKVEREKVNIEALKEAEQ